MAKPRPPGRKPSDTNPEAGPPASMKTPDNSLVSGPTHLAQKKQPGIRKTMLMGMQVMTEPPAGDDSSALMGKKLAESENGWYEWRGLLGEGGMGAVYKYQMKKFSKRGDLIADEPKAIKVVKFNEVLAGLEGEERENAREELYRRFIEEVQLIYRLKHDYIVRIDDFGEDFPPDHQPYMVMEFLEGEDLNDMIHNNGPLPWEQARILMLQVCKGLEFAHNYFQKDPETGEEKPYPVVHRDIKPENIFVITNNIGERTAKILDFGIAKVVEETGKDPYHGKGIIIGTPLYMAPEQALDKAIDERTDIYGLGSTMYHALTGTTVFHGEKISDILAQLVTDEKAKPLREKRSDLDIPEIAEKIVMRCIEKDPNERYQSMAELREDLMQRGGMNTMELARLRSGELEPAQSGDFPPVENGEGVQAVDMNHSAHSLSQFGSAQIESPGKKRLGLIAGLAGVAIAGAITVAVVMNRSPKGEVNKTPASATKVVHDARAPMPKPLQKDAGVKVHIPSKEKERTVTFVTKLEGVQVFKGKELLCTTAGKEGACTITLEKGKPLKVVLKKKGYKNKRYEILKDALGSFPVTLERKRRRGRRRNMGIVISKPE